MNANELADVLMSTKFQVDEDGTMIGVSHQAVNEAATMLRQQQAEIEALKKFKAEIEAENKKCFEAALRADDVWKRATGKAQEK